MAVELTADDIVGLAEKLDALDLTETERAILDAVLGRASAADDDVSGFALTNNENISSFAINFTKFSAAQPSMGPTAARLSTAVQMESRKNR